MKMPSEAIVGNWIMVLCACFYLAWWIVTFKPPEPHGTNIGRICLMLAFLTGISGVIVFIKGLNATAGQSAGGIPALWIFMGAVVSYVILLLVSTAVFQRQVTSELMIIIAWGMQQIFAVDHLLRTGNIESRALFVMIGIVFAAVFISIVCYILYYRLPYTASYIDGCIPLVLAALVMSVINIVGMTGSA